MHNLRYKLWRLQYCDGGQCPDCGGYGEHKDLCELAALLAIRLDHVCTPRRYRV